MSQAEAIWAAGTMSGTSLDGIDLALLKTDGTDIVEFGPSGYRPYSSDEHTALRHALGTWPTEGSNAQAFALDVVQESHLAALNGVNADIIGFHAQTLNHDPGSQRTFQLGDGAALAKTLGRPVAWDFRSADVAAGGEGAPLAPLFHDAVARWAQLSGTVAFLNLGGVGNITWIREVGEDPLADGAVLAFDTGPANAPINDLMQKHYGRPFDAGAKVAESGQSDAHHEGALLDHPYFKRAIPKSLDRDTFSSAVEDLSDLPPENAVATATAWVSRSVEDGISRLPSAPETVFVCGGGRHNPKIMRDLAARLAADIHPVEYIGVDGDMLEANAFAYLAVRVQHGLPLSLPGTTGVPYPMPGGRISVP